jgi:hypothetical protein
MDALILKELAVWATASGGGLFLVLKLLQKIGSGVRAAVAADDKSVSLLDRLERQLAEQEARHRVSEDRLMAQVQDLERRAATSSTHAEQAVHERNEARVRAERLSFVVLTLREDVRRLQSMRSPPEFPEPLPHGGPPRPHASAGAR